ncbi:MAG: hypothetical protein OEM23_02410 [Gemmatimonadota bacterium]|nr:hypothetical protein [Gemmatimonadota bacterium]MDH3427263.1 hypothetical protein [Gemmatimonadota bacterium]
MLTVLPAAAAGQTPVLVAPYQIESVETRFDIYDGEMPMIGVAFKRAPDSSDPEAGMASSELAPPEWVTIIGEAGWLHASLSSVEKRCEFPCSLDGGDECHWTGLYVPAGVLADVGTPVAAIPGRLELTEFTRLDEDTGETESLARLEAGGEYAPMLWERTPDWTPAYRVDSWDEATGLLNLTIVQPGGEPQSIPARECRTTPREWLLTVDCGGLSLLASAGRPLLLSWPDYNSAKVDVIARFDYAGSRHYVVRFGSKAQDLVGFVSGEPAGWRARFRQRDWAQLC